MGTAVSSETTHNNSEPVVASGTAHDSSNALDVSQSFAHMASSTSGIPASGSSRDFPRFSGQLLLVGRWIVSKLLVGRWSRQEVLAIIIFLVYHLDFIHSMDECVFYDLRFLALALILGVACMEVLLLV